MRIGKPLTWPRLHSNHLQPVRPHPIRRFMTYDDDNQREIAFRTERTLAERFAVGKQLQRSRVAWASVGRKNLSTLGRSTSWNSRTEVRTAMWSRDRHCTQ